MRCARLTNGMIVPITIMYNSDAEPTNNIKEAVTFVAGSDTLGQWFSGRVSGYGDDKELTDG